MTKSIKSYLVYGIAAATFLGAVVPFVSLAQSMSSSNMPLLCYDFQTNLKMGNKGGQVRNLQLVLQKEGFPISIFELGTFGSQTAAATARFQEKYRGEILTPSQLSSGNGYVGKITRMKLNSLYGCDAPVSYADVPVPSATQMVCPTVSPLVCASPSSGLLPSSTPLPSVTANLQIKNIALDLTGVTATFCNLGTTKLSSAPFRIRLNGVNRDFDVVEARDPGVCQTTTYGYPTWGVTYDGGSTYNAIGIIDPYGIYKTQQLTLPLTATTTLTVPAIPGIHLSVRSVTLKTSGVQATFCNLGTEDVLLFPVRIKLNGVSFSPDITAAHKAGVCQTMTWGYDIFGLTYSLGAVYTASVDVDPNNIIKETNKFDNSASIVGTP